MKNIVYSVTRTNAMNVGDATVIAVTPEWKIVLYAATAVTAVLTALCAGLWILRRWAGKQ